VSTRDFTPHSNVDVDTSDIRAGRICDRCGTRWNYNKLVLQTEYAGTTTRNSRILVCPKCVDEPNPQSRILVIHDDYSARVTRPVNSIYIDGSSDFTITSHPGANLFRGVSNMTCELTKEVIADDGAPSSYSNPYIIA
jgi:hypothetical protein